MNFYRISNPGQSDEETGKLIDEEVRKLVSDAYQRAKMLLQENKESLKKAADLLLKKEVIFNEDLESILGKRPDGIDAEKAKTLIQAAAT
jgi:AFG3 family protein